MISNIYTWCTIFHPSGSVVNTIQDFDNSSNWEYNDDSISREQKIEQNILLKCKWVNVENGNLSPNYGPAAEVYVVALNTSDAKDCLRHFWWSSCWNRRVWAWKSQNWIRKACTFQTDRLSSCTVNSSNVWRATDQSFIDHLEKTRIEQMEPEPASETLWF
jgi:hypothetical protein